MLGEILLTAVNAVFPILLLILLGYILRQRGFLTGEFVKLGNKLVFKICLPMMLFINIYDIDGFASIRWDFVLFACGVCLLMVGIAFVVALLSTKDPRRRGVVMQCVFRSNFAIIGLPLAQILGGAEAVATAAVLLAFTIPLFNTFAVIALSIFLEENGRRPSARTVALNILKNPLIIASAAGLLSLLLRQIQTEIFGSPVFTLSGSLEFLYITMGYLKNVTTPLSLIVLGGQFTFTAVKGMRREIVIATFFRVVAAPVIGIGLTLLFNSLGILSCGVTEYPALVSLFGTPVAVSSAVMAGAMGNDEQLATQLVVWTSVCSMFTLFAIICVLMGMGLLPV